ncbi:hypothetical protein ACP275_01G071800 [Erythranthe tilingii]
MDQFRQIGEVLGSLKALMVMKHEISINQRQCCLLFDMLELAFETISDEIRQNLKLEDKNTNKWKPLEFPMKELHKVFKECDLYIRQCTDVKEWWGRVISLHMNRDCLELHIHNLLSSFPVVIEAIETAAEISALDQEDMQKRRISLMQKYDQECDDLKHFLWKFGKEYLVPIEICARLENAWSEDRWLLVKKIEGSKKTGPVGEILIKKMNGGDSSDRKLPPSNVLVGAQDYLVKRRLASTGGNLKEIHWMGENFALRTFYGDVGPLYSEISTILSLSHPNVLQYLCAFYDEDRKEGFLVMELMSKDLGSYIKENSGQRNRVPFSIPIAVDIMLQIARGMEYLHSKKICHGVLNPSSVLLKAKNASIGGFQAKVAGFGLSSIKSYYTSKSPKKTEVDLDIWLAPEILTELEGNKNISPNYTEKADVYSFGMLCFELLTGKVPFEDGHLQGEKMARNIRAGERPLFSYPSPKYLTNLTKKCWQTNPNLRPSFSSICRVLRYIKKILVINPDHGHPDSPPPLVDYCDMEAGYLKKFPEKGGGGVLAPPVLQIPFQMFTYKIVEKEKFYSKKWEIHRPASMFDEDHNMDDFLLAPSDRRSVCSEIIDTKNSGLAVDMRSVISEIPQRKMYPLDQSSFGSESPRRKLSSKSFNLERRIDQNSTSRELREVLDKAIIASKVAESSQLVTKVTEQKAESTEILEKKQSLRPIVDKNTKSLEGEMILRPTRNRKLSEIPEKIVKNGESIKNTDEKTEEKTGKTTVIIKKMKDVIKTKKVEENRNRKTRPVFSAASSPARAFGQPEAPKNEPIRMKKKTMSVSSPASSPYRVFRKCSQSEASPKDESPSRMMKKKSVPESSPASSPSRTFATCASPSPRQVSACHSSMENNSSSSPLDPCGRCSRLGRQTSLPAVTVGPQRPHLDRVSSHIA